MSITIDVGPDMEQQLRQAAAQAGLAPETYIIELLRERLSQSHRHANNERSISPSETELLLQINQSLSGITWARYHELVAKRKVETLMEDEQQELIDLTDQIETANAQRISYLVELAQLRRTPLDALMHELGLKSTDHD
ncbi:MAG: hypothetical protein MI924_20755 [Chloroflexales bacterium]|nr:hypothetical protein [Chloroflexales bacterium]